MNKSINAIIVDDEKKGRELLKIVLSEHCPNVNIIGMANSAVQAFELINEVSPDLVFLDIEMPGGNGFDLLERFKEIKFSVIFVTAYDRYAIKAFKFSAVDYLLKPIDEEDLVRAVNKASRPDHLRIREDVESLTHNYKNSKAGNNKLALSTLEGLIFVEIADITRCKASGKYTCIYLNNKKEILATKNLGEFEDFLSEHNFIRVHHTHLV